MSKVLQNLNEDEISQVKPLFILVETILTHRKLDKDALLNEFEKYINYFFQGKDILNSFERRNAGIEDDIWNYAKNNFYKFFEITEEQK